jgi:hypothetical protein
LRAAQLVGLLMVNQFLSPGQLNRLRALNLRGMPDLVTVRIPVAPTPDGYGSDVEDFTDGPTVPCRFRMSTQRADSVEGGQGRNQELFLFLVPIETVIDVNYRLRRNGVEYEVTGTPSDSSHQLSKLVLARKVV